MRKKVLMLAALSLLLMLPFTGAWGSLYGANEVQNGDFETGDLSHWTVSGSVGVFYETIGGGNYFAGTYFGPGPTGGSIYQLIDEGIAPGTAKLWSFKGDYDVFPEPINSVRFALYYYPTNPTTQPAFDASWTNFLDHTIYGDVHGTYQARGIIETFQPRWVAVFIQMDCPTGAALVDNIDFEGKCVPLPGAALLLGSGLLGLAGWRRLRKS